MLPQTSPSHFWSRCQISSYRLGYLEVVLMSSGRSVMVAVCAVAITACGTLEPQPICRTHRRANGDDHFHD